MTVCRRLPARTAYAADAFTSDRPAGHALNVPALAIGILALLSAAAALGMAARVFLARPDRRRNRALAWFLLLAAMVLCSYNGLRWLIIDARTTYALAMTEFVAASLYVYAYLRFLGTLDTPWSAWIRTRWGHGVMLAAFGIMAISPLLWPSLWTSGVRFDERLQVYSIQAGPYATPYSIAIIAVFVYAILTATSNLRHAQNALDRKRGKWILAGFGAADSLIILGIATETWPPAGADGGFWLFVSGASYPLAILALVACLGYGVLQAQLFDVRIHMQRGAVLLGALATATAILMTMQAGLESRLPGWASDGLAVLGLLLLVMTAHRILRAIGSRWDPAAPELDLRRVQVYESALHEARQEGLDLWEDAVLQRLRQDLHISGKDHHLLAMAHETKQALVPGALWLGRYRILRSLDAQTVLAQDEQVGRRVAIRTLPDSILPEVHAKAWSQIQHPNVVGLYDVIGTRDGQHLVLQYRRGQGDAPLDVAGLAAGLQALHAAGIVHGALAPEQVWIDGDGRPGWCPAGATPPDITATLEAPTPDAMQFLSPERARGASASRSDDVWAFGATVFQALYQRPYVHVHPGDSAAEVRMAVASMGAPPHMLPGWLRRCLDPDPSGRPSARELVDELAATHAGTEIPVTAQTG